VKTFWGVLYTLAFIILLILLGRIVFIDSRINADITVKIQNAQEASSFEEMAAELKEARLGLEKWGITKGDAGLIFKPPLNDAALFYAALKKVQKDVQVLKNLNLDKDTSAYFTTLEETQRTLEAFDFPFTWHWIIHRGHFSILLLFIILAILSGVLVLKSR